MNKSVILISILLGIILFAVSVVYFITPANALPHFFPGYTAGLSKHHVTHGAAALILGIGAFIFAWFSSGKKKSP